MKCVILAAGIGKRLRPLTAKTPKCLLTIGGRTLLERTLDAVLANGIREIAIVTGFEGAKVRAKVSRAFPRVQVTFLHNARFRVTNNAYSLSLARAFAQHSSFLLLDSDILFPPLLLDALATPQRKPNRIAVRVSGPHDNEEIRVKINRWDHVLEIGKHIPLAETFGESVGIEMFSAPASRTLFETLDRRMKEAAGKKEFYEAAFQEMIDTGTRFWAIDISKFPVVEIDTPADYALAERMISDTDHA
ncbi:MAG: phosphocholine cytidylyltransferase family protein [Bacteroidota bacterium]